MLMSSLGLLMYHAIVGHAYTPRSLPCFSSLTPMLNPNANTETIPAMQTPHVPGKRQGKCSV